MIEEILILKMDGEEKVKKELDELLKKAEESGKKEDLDEFKFVLDDYLDQGYRVKDYIFKYNSLFNKKSN